MMGENILVFILISSGAVILIISLFAVRTILHFLKDRKQRKIWKILNYLIVFFALGYITSLILLQSDKEFFGLILTGIIFFSGSLFVLLVVGISKKTILELIQTKTKVEISEAKYRNLVESTNDIVFTLNEKADFLSCNQAIRTRLGFDEKEILQTNIVDITYNPDDYLSLNQHLIKEKLKELFSEKKPVEFRARFRHKFQAEPVELHVKLELLSSTNGMEIIGKASDIIEDVLFNFFEAEKQSYLIPNFLSSAEFMSTRACRNLPKFISIKEAGRLRICLREMILNSIEHGNLNISFDEKTKALENDEYFNLIKSRQKNQDNFAKKVRIEYSINQEKVAFRITDQGEGFDFRKMARESQALKEKTLEHGRGIMMAKMNFDEVQYKGNGNQVVLVKHFK